MERDAGTGEKGEYLRRLSSVNDLIQAVYRSRKAGVRGIPRELVAEASRAVIQGIRQAILEARDELSLKEIKTSADELAPLVEEEVKRRLSPSLRRVVNATGVVVHTNLGRSLLPRAAVEALEMAATRYTNLEFEVEEGRRGSRQVHLRRLLCELTGAESALVVNNNAAAVLLALTAHAQGREVIVSRGELIEIGGSFRLPEIMAQSGARLVEVGTTNKTYLEDYRRAITEDTAVILKAHTSNYRIVGFTAQVTVEELASLAAEHGLILMEDLGSGTYVDLSEHGLPWEPTVKSSLEAGADLVTFSGDKLLGGPQAGIVLGRAELVEKMARHPLARAVRIDKLSLAALEATLRIYFDPAAALQEIPTLRMLTEDQEALRSRAEGLAARIREIAPSLAVEVARDVSRAGGGSLPQADIPTWTVTLRWKGHGAEELEGRLRRHSIPIIARVKNDRVIIDVRTLLEDEPAIIAEALGDITSATRGE